MRVRVMLSAIPKPLTNQCGLTRDIPNSLGYSRVQWVQRVQARRRFCSQLVILVLTKRLPTKTTCQRLREVYLYLMSYFIFIT